MWQAEILIITDPEPEKKKICCFVFLVYVFFFCFVSCLFSFLHSLLGGQVLHKAFTPTAIMGLSTSIFRPAGWGLAGLESVPARAQRSSPVPLSSPACSLLLPTGMDTASARLGGRLHRGREISSQQHCCVCVRELSVNEGVRKRGT